MKKLLILVEGIFILLSNSAFSQDNADKFDKIITEIAEIRKDIVEIKTEIAVLKEGQNYINKRIDDVGQGLTKRIDDLQNIMLTGFAILFSGMFVVVGFVIWDRRTALAPAIKQIDELSQKEKVVGKVLDVLKGYAMEEPRFKEIMHTAGLL